MKDLVYLIQAHESDKYKIGITSQENLDKRLKALQTGNAAKLILVKTVITKHASLVERTMHRGHKSKNQVGEWFVLTTEDVLNFEEDCNKIINNLEILVKLGNPFVSKQK